MDQHSIDNNCSYTTWSSILKIHNIVIKNGAKLLSQYHSNTTRSNTLETNAIVTPHGTTFYRPTQWQRHMQQYYRHCSDVRWINTIDNYANTTCSSTLNVNTTVRSHAAYIYGTTLW